MAQVLECRLVSASDIVNVSAPYATLVVESRARHTTDAALKLGATVTATVSGGSGKLDAWIDFNGDGSWTGPGEQVLASQSVVTFTNNLTFDVPRTSACLVRFAGPPQDLHLPARVG